MYKRQVYLPDGDWYDYYTGEKYSGGRYILADAPLDKVPVFIKAGAIIPVDVYKRQAYNRYNGESTFGVNKKAPKDQQAVAQDFVKFFLCDDESQIIMAKD